MRPAHLTECVNDDSGYKSLVTSSIETFTLNQHMMTQVPHRRNGSPHRSSQEDDRTKKAPPRPTSRSAATTVESEDYSKASARSENSRRKKEVDPKGPRFYRSDRSFSLRTDSSRSLGGHGGRYLDNFYSSRRSLYSSQNSSKSLENPPPKNSMQVAERSNSATNSDQAPKPPPKRNVEDESSVGNESVSDMAPRQPMKRTSIDLAPAATDDANSTTQTGANGAYTKYPEELFSNDNDSKRQGARSSMDADSNAKNDSSPRIPKKRESLTCASNVDRERHVTPPPQQDMEAAPADDDDDVFYIDSSDAYYLGGDGDSSVTSELTSPTVNVEFQRPESYQTSFSSTTSPTKLSVIFQQGLKERRRERQKKFDPTEPWTERDIEVTNNSGQSVRSGATFSSGRTHGSRRQGSCMSVISSRTRLSLSSQVHTLLEMAAEVVNADDLDHATFCYQKASQAAGLEIMNINVNLGHKQPTDDPASVASRNSSHEDLRMIGIIIGMMRTKMALMHALESEYDRAIEMCKGALQVQRHQPALRANSPKIVDDTDLASLMVLIIERLENGQACLEDHKELLDKIDLHSTVSDFTETETIQSSTKEIMLDMLERSAHDDQSAIFQYDECALEMLSVHAAEQDKHDEGIRYCRDALQIHLVALGLKHPHAGKSLLRVARMYRGKGSDRFNEELVLGYFQQTAAVLQRSNLSQRARVSVLNDIAVIHMRRLDFDEAIKFLLDALHAYDEEIDDESISGGRHIATLRVWRNLGECYMQLDKFSIAEGALLKALAIQRDCRKMQDAAEKLEIRAIKLDKSLRKLTSDTSIADTICRIGKARAGGGDYKKALGIYRDALVVLNRNVKSDDDYTELEKLEKRDQLTQTLYCIAKAESANKEFDKALGMYQLSLKLRKSSGAETKDKRLSTRIHCMSCFLGIGDVFMKQKEFAQAMIQFKDALEYAVVNEVRENHPLILSTEQKLKEAEKAMKVASKKSPRVVLLEKKADSEIERGALDAATETLKELLVIHRASLKRLKDNELDTSEQVYAIACLLQTFGFVFAKNGDDENAERAFKDASRLFRKGGQHGTTRANL